MTQAPNLPCLTTDERIWRLDWLGEVAYPASVRRSAQPSVQVALSPLCCDPNDCDALIRPDATDHHHERDAWAPVAALPFLAIGDLWQGGRRIASPSYQAERFEGLRVEPNTVAFVKAGLAIDEHFLLPLSHHPWHRRHTQSYCVSVALDDGRRVLIPCLEVIRFYFGSSGNLVQRLFTAPLAADALWSHKRFDAVSRHLHLVLANGLSGSSAADIGRIAQSRLAWRLAAGIVGSCQKAAVQRHPVYPYTGFPFEGCTDLAAHGVWLPFGEQAWGTFLAYRLASCSHAFPFQSLSYEAADRQARYAGGAGDRNRTVRRSKGRTGRRMATDADPGDRAKQRRAAFSSERRFPDLQRKPVWRERIEALASVDIYLRHADGRLEQVAFGEPSGASDVVGQDAVRTAGKPTTAPPRFVQRGLALIRAAASARGSVTSLTLVCPPGFRTPVFSLPVVIDESGALADALLCTLPSGHVRQRRACFVECRERAGGASVVLIVEGKASAQMPDLCGTAKVDVLAAALWCLKGRDGAQRHGEP